MGKRIGILTFSSAYNFGAVLQCYALYQTIKNLGYDVKVIDYRPHYLASNPKKSLYRKIRRFLRRLLIERRFKSNDWEQLMSLYENFERKNLRLSDTCTTKEELGKVLNEFDEIVVGSDQIWNSKYNGKDEAWYGLEDGDQRKWITYAASAGNANFTKEDLDALKKALPRFEFLSMREEFLTNKLQPLISKEIKTVVDPSLLGNPIIWERWKEIRPVDGSYILTYQARESQKVFDIAKRLSQEEDKIVPLDFYANVEKNGLQTPIVPPSCFISLISNSKCLVTTSFHGVAFSIILNKPFYYVKLNDGADGRAIHLLKELGLESRIIDDKGIKDIDPIDYNPVNSKLAELREKSMDYLKEALR